MAWNTNRAARLPSDWEKGIRPRILARDPVCRTCNQAPSAEVDHILRGDDHRDINLQGLCARCHQSKTQQEAAAVRWAPNKRTARQPERHPGLR